MIGDCSARGEVLSAISPRPALNPHLRVAPMGPQGPPVPSASLSVDRAALRGQVPPMDYRDNPSCSPKRSPPPNMRGFRPPSTFAEATVRRTIKFRDQKPPKTRRIACSGSYARPPRAVTLDIDDTVDVVHGHQQLALFNAHYDERCFQPIHVYDTATSQKMRSSWQGHKRGVRSSREPSKPSSTAA